MAVGIESAATLRAARAAHGIDKLVVRCRTRRSGGFRYRFRSTGLLPVDVMLDRRAVAGEEMLVLGYGEQTGICCANGLDHASRSQHDDFCQGLSRAWKRFDHDHARTT